MRRCADRCWRGGRPRCRQARARPRWIGEGNGRRMRPIDGVRLAAGVRCGPPKRFPAASRIERSLSIRSRRSVPSPEPVSTLTVYVVPLPVIDEIEVATGPAAVITKSAASTPVTDSLKVTVKATLDADVGDEPARTIERTVGAVLSTTYMGPGSTFAKTLPARSWTEEVGDGVQLQGAITAAGGDDDGVGRAAAGDGRDGGARGTAGYQREGGCVDSQDRLAVGGREGDRAGVGGAGRAEVMETIPARSCRSCTRGRQWGRNRRSALPDKSVIAWPLSLRFNCNEPSPVPLLTATS